MVAEGVNATPFVTPPVQVYVKAPPPDKVALPPGQTVLGAVAVTVGEGFTVNVLTTGNHIPEQPPPITSKHSCIQYLLHVYDFVEVKLDSW